MTEYQEYPKVMVHPSYGAGHAEFPPIIVSDWTQEEAKAKLGYVKNSLGNRKAFESLSVTAAPPPNKFEEFPKALIAPEILVLDGKPPSMLVKTPEEEQAQRDKWEKEIVLAEEKAARAIERASAAPRVRDEKGHFIPDKAIRVEAARREV